MLKRDSADKLYCLVINRFAEEHPGRELTSNERDGIWYAIYGKLCRGEPETEVEEWCKTVPLAAKSIHRPIRNGY